MRFTPEQRATITAELPNRRDRLDPIYQNQPR
jgi:hypothetical protein